MAGDTRTTREIYSGDFYKFYSSFASDIDLAADSHTATGYGRAQRNCRRIVPFTSGNIVVTRPDGTNVTITGVVAGQILDIQASKIISSGTTITSALVLW